MKRLKFLVLRDDVFLFILFHFCCFFFCTFKFLRTLRFRYFVLNLILCSKITVCKLYYVIITLNVECEQIILQDYQSDNVGTSQSKVDDLTKYKLGNTSSTSDKMTSMNLTINDFVSDAYYVNQHERLWKIIQNTPRICNKLDETVKY